MLIGADHDNPLDANADPAVTKTASTTDATTIESRDLKDIDSRTLPAVASFGETGDGHRPRNLPVRDEWRLARLARLRRRARSLTDLPPRASWPTIAPAQERARRRRGRTPLSWTTLGCATGDAEGACTAAKQNSASSSAGATLVAVPDVLGPRRVQPVPGVPAPRLAGNSVVMLWRMQFDETTIDGLDKALNESTVCGIYRGVAPDQARLLVEVEALPKHGPIDPDPRRALVMTGVSSIEVDLHLDASGDGPRVQLASLDAVEAFFASLAWWHSIYGWSFIDMKDRIAPWPTNPSLKIAVRDTPAAHSLEWFTECGTAGGSYILRGIVRFTALSVERADGTEMTLQHFIDDGARRWEAFRARDPRLSVASQRAPAVHWRPNANNATGASIPGGDPAASD
jgi:hypothetical protein